MLILGLVIAIAGALVAAFAERTVGIVIAVIGLALMLVGVLVAADTAEALARF